MTTSRDVAAAAGVSQATVSRVLNTPDAVSPKTRDRVHAAIDKLGYYPHSGAIAMKTQRTRTIGVVVSELSNPFFRETFETLSEEFSTAGSRVIVWNSALHEHDAIRALQERSIDGVIISAWDENSHDMQEILSAGLPVVLLNRTSLSRDFDSITSDNIAGGQLVARYLHENDRRNLVFVQGNPETSTSSERLEGFTNGLQLLSAPKPHLIDGDFSFDTTLNSTREYIHNYGCPDAFFCANDYMAFAVINVLRADGYSIPEDVWVIGYDDVQQSDWPLFDLTTVQQDSRRMAQLGAQRLLERIEDPSKPAVKEKLPVRLTIRGSTGHHQFSRSPDGL